MNQNFTKGSWCWHFTRTFGTRSYTFSTAIISTHAVFEGLQNSAGEVTSALWSLTISWMLRRSFLLSQHQWSVLQSTHLSSVQLSATKFHFHSLLSQKHDDERRERREWLTPSPGILSIPVLNVLKCCQSAHISCARQANRINPGLTLQARVQGNGLC